MVLKSSTTLEERCVYNTCRHLLFQQPLKFRNQAELTSAPKVFSLFIKKVNSINGVEKRRRFRDNWLLAFSHYHTPKCTNTLSDLQLGSIGCVSVMGPQLGADWGWSFMWERAGGTARGWRRPACRCEAGRFFFTVLSYFKLCLPHFQPNVSFHQFVSFPPPTAYVPHISVPALIPQSFSPALFIRVSCFFHLFLTHSSFKYTLSSFCNLINLDDGLLNSATSIFLTTSCFSSQVAILPSI